MSKLQSKTEESKYERNWNKAKETIATLKSNGAEDSDVRQIVKFIKLIIGGKVTSKIKKKVDVTNTQ
jgi:hypothetical protein